MNVVIISGNLARDPEQSTTNSGMVIAKFTLAVARMTKKTEETSADFIRVIVFDKQAEHVTRYLGKGSKVAVEGRIQTGSYQNKDGKTVYTTDVIANRVEFLDKKKDRQEEAQEHGDGFSEGPEDDDDMPF